MSSLIVAPATYTPYPGTEIRAEHGHPPVTDGRPCEPCVAVRCRDCRVLVAPCTLTAISVKQIVRGRFRCAVCRSGGRR
jgi:hypothetical protein